ncbi:MAG: adenylate kinase [Candidatus Micrarchaeota archaeon]
MIVVLGIPGAGKSTVLREIKKELPDWKMMNYGDVMLELALAKKLVSNRDEIRKLPTRAQKELQREAARKISAEKGKVILDTHCSIATPRGHLPGLPFDILKELNVDSFVLITAPSQEILRRRHEDSTRARDIQPLEALEEVQLINKALLAAYAAFTGAPAIIIQNADGKLDDAVEKLKSVLR